LKVIIQNSTDFAWAEEIASKVKTDCYLLLQPEWSRQQQITPAIIDYIKKFPQWRLSLQVHKFLKIP